MEYRNYRTTNDHLRRHTLDKHMLIKFLYVNGYHDRRESYYVYDFNRFIQFYYILTPKFSFQSNLFYISALLPMSVATWDCYWATVY